MAARVRECGFAPHPAAVALRADPVPADRPDPTVAELDLSHCDPFLLDKGAAVEADRRTPAGRSRPSGACSPPPRRTRRRWPW
ncbi:MAG: hypothetical protein U0871_00370 [Gemmataceae bacterium]